MTHKILEDLTEEEPAVPRRHNNTETHGLRLQVHLVCPTPRILDET
jgi:hypothetical protein